MNVKKGGGLPQITLRVLALAGLSLTVGARQPALAATAAGIGLLLYVWSLRADPTREDCNTFRWAGLAVGAVLLIRVAGGFEQLGESEESIRPVWLGLILVAAALAVVAGNRRRWRLVSITAAMLAVLTVTIVMTVSEWRSDVGTDVYWIHREAGEALFGGENPYTDAVQVFNGSPFAPQGSIVEGYAYPPVALGTYGVAGKGLDPRLISSLTWIGVLSWLAWRARGAGRDAEYAFAVFLLVAGIAVWPLVWFAAWTEPLSIALFLMASLWWDRRPVWSAVMLGLALASKQYFVFLAPLLLLYRGDRTKRVRVVVSLGVAATTILMGLLPNPEAYIKATVLNLTEVGFRPDSRSLSTLLAPTGIDFYLPTPVWLVIGLVLAALVARGVRDVWDFVGATGLILGFVFFLGQALINYWLLVAGLLAIATVLGVGEREGASVVDPHPHRAKDLSPMPTEVRD